MKTREEKAFEVLELTGLNWTVTKEQLQRQDGTPTESYGIFRNDNGIQLNTGVKEGYNVYQNFEMMHDMIDVIGNSLHLNNIKDVRGGSLQDGRKVFVSFPLESIGIGQNNDTLKRYITFLNSHDGSSSICLGSSNTVVSCSNTFFRVAKELNKVRHTASMNGKIHTLKMNLIDTIEQEKVLVEAMQSLVGKPFESDDFVNMVNMTYNKESLDYELLSTRKKNQIQQLQHDIQHEISEKGSDMWGLWNGITLNQNHSVKDGMRNIMTGQGLKIQNNTLDYALSK
jgi:hypothetical protein